MTLTPERLSAVLRWLDAAQQQADMPRAAVLAAREAVLSDDPRAWARCEQVRTLTYLSGVSLAIRNDLGSDAYADMKDALLDLWEQAVQDGQGYDDEQAVVMEDRWQRRFDAYLHAVHARGLDTEALLSLRTRGLFLLAVRGRYRKQSTGPRCVRPANRSARTPARRRVITTPMSCNAPPLNRESRMPARILAPP